MMSPEIVKILKDERKSPVHQALLDHCMKLLKKSRIDMANHYADWDKMHETFMHRRPVDSNDIESVRAGLPKKIVLPLATSQVFTGVAYAYMLLTQRPRFYEFTGIEDKDKATSMREAAELLVQNDLDANNHKQQLLQSLLDLFRFGMFCQVDSWETDYEYLPVTTQGPAPMYQGQPIGEGEVITKVEKVTIREGNRIRTISPYRVFPDTGFHLSDWQKGSFIAWDDSYSRCCLEGMEANGDVVGTEYIQKYNGERIERSGRSKMSRVAGIDFERPSESDVVCLTTMIVKLTPSKIKPYNDSPESLGDETYPHRWLIGIANDDRVVRAEPLPNWHAQFPASIGMFLPDQHECVLNSLSRLSQDIQALVSWLLNSRMAAVTRTIEPQSVVDPIGLNMDDLNARQRLIRLRKEAGGKDVRRYYMPLPVTDTTQGHVADMQQLIGLLQMVTGVNDNALGQVASGRRSATENRAANMGAASRLKMVIDVVWGMAFQPQANRLLKNHRQSATQESLMTVLGEAMTTEIFEQFKGDAQTIARAYDYVAYDGTLPTDKLFMAQSLQELLSLLISNPMASAAFNMDPNKVQKEIMVLRGMGTGAQFGFDQVPMNLIAALQMENQGQQPAGPPAQQS